MINNRQRKSFQDDMISEDLLDDAIQWIRNNLSIEDVFSEEELTSWAENYGFVKEQDQ